MSDVITPKLIEVPDLPVIEPEIVSGMILRQSAGQGSLGDTEINLSTTGGLGGCSVIAEITVPGHDTVYVSYNLAPIVQEIATKVTEAVERQGKKKEKKKK